MRALLEKFEFGGLDEPACDLPAPSTSFACLHDDEGSLAALADGSLAAKFHYWRGASGRRYVFSVHDRASCPAYDHAILLAATKDRYGRRRIAFIADTGALPELALARAIRVGGETAVELQTHLLAASAALRAEIIADLSEAR
ncbi:MAG TPA: hypothetical protein VEK35_08585 [Roseiarcus sp.]|nr:hypothetical protein [Roseiarcus sp.]